ncbi:MAG: sn-glycerol-3-phosphate ABC transporter ATP-binding protein UgpC [Candidatus Sericytochromatia bacterium]
MAEVKLKNIVKTFGENVHIIKNLTLEIHDGEFLVLVGGSGCGKSTTLRLIAGLETCNSGDIMIGTKRVNDLPPKDRDIAMVFQNYALYPHMSVYENIAFGLKLRKVSANIIKKKVNEAAEMLDLTQYLQRKPKELSGGQRQRVALGRAIVRDAQVLLFDEPLSNLDAKLRTQTRTEIKKLHQKMKTTTVYVTHDQTEAMTMGDRIAVMRDGIIQQLATPKEAYEFPLNLFVAGFIGSPSMNFLKVKVSEIGLKHIDLVSEGLHLKLPYNSQITNISDYQGKEVILGVRPEHITVSNQKDEEDKYKCMQSWLEVVEPSGSRTYLHASIGKKHQITAEVDTTSIQGELNSGTDISLEIDVNRVHLFDPQTEKTILSTQKFV